MKSATDFSSLHRNFSGNVRILPEKEKVLKFSLFSPPLLFSLHHPTLPSFPQLQCTNHSPSCTIIQSKDIGDVVTVYLVDR
jgi:hypothetical protein